MQEFSAFLSAAWKKLAYAVLIATVWLHNAWRSVKAWAERAAAAPALRPLARLLAPGSAAGITGSGTRPRQPQVLAVVIAEELEQEEDAGEGAGALPARPGGSPAGLPIGGAQLDLAALCRLIGWASRQHLRYLVLYEPSGLLQRQASRLELLLRQQQLLGGVRLEEGFHPQRGRGRGARQGQGRRQQQQQQQQQSAQSAGWEAAQPRSGAAEATEGGGAQSRAGRPGEEAESERMVVLMLSAADGQWPLLAAAAAAQQPSEQEQQEEQQQPPNGRRLGSQGATPPQPGSGAAAASPLEAAVAAPTKLRDRLEAVAGPGAGLEPDLVLVSLRACAHPPAVSLSCVSTHHSPALPRVCTHPPAVSCMCTHPPYVATRVFTHPPGVGTPCLHVAALLALPALLLVSSLHMLMCGVIVWRPTSPCPRGQWKRAWLGLRLALTPGPGLWPPSRCTQVTGGALTLAGYPPWAVRVSEIHGIGPLSGVTSSKLAAVLQRYRRTRQRFGQ